MRKPLLLFLFLGSLIFGCKPEKENIDFEKKVLIEVIPSIVDSICGDPRIPFRPTLGKYVEKADRMILDTLLTSTEQRNAYKKWEKELDSLKKDTTSLYLAFNPIIKPSNDELKIELEKHFGRRTLDNPHIESCEIDLNEIKLYKHFKFKHDSLFLKTRDMWNKNYDFVFSGFFEISRILFDESKNYGILSTGYQCNDRCGRGYLAFIKKVNGKWIIDKLKMTWVS